MNAEKFWRKILNTLTIVARSTATRDSFISFDARLEFRLIALSLHCLFRKVNKLIKISSIGANDGIYGEIKAIIAPDFLKIFKIVSVL